MKDESGDITINVLTTTKWQPSVLQLLPFSSNNVGDKLARQASYLDKGPGKGLPTLTVAHSGNSRPRSKSANFPAGGRPLNHFESYDNEDSHKHNDDLIPKDHQPQRHFRVSSEKLSRKTPEGTPGSIRHRFKLRARSDYGISSFAKRPDVVKISVNDINEQILGSNSIKSSVPGTGHNGRIVPDFSDSNFPSRYMNGDGDGEIKKTVWSRGNGFSSKEGKTPLPKSVLKQSGRHPQFNLNYWSSVSSPNPLSGKNRGDITAAKGQRSGDQDESRMSKTNAAKEDISLRRDGRRVKMNVKDLPRSKTPIADNDPDRLNMQHVIAFLQSSPGSGRDMEEKTVASAESCLSPVPVSKVKPVANVVARSSSPAKHAALNGVVPASNGSHSLISLRANEDCSSSPPGKKNRLSSTEDVEVVTPHRFSVRQGGLPADNLENSRSDSTAAIHGPASRTETESLELYRKTRASSNNLSQATALQYSDFNGHSVSSSHVLENRSAPLSSEIGYPDLQEAHIPLSIRKIREGVLNGSGSTKPFRLHRFLTLVPTGSEALLNPLEKGYRMSGTSPLPRAASHACQVKEQKNRAGQLSGRSASRRTTPLKKVRDVEEQSVYFLDVNTPFEDERRPRSKGDTRANRGRGTKNSRYRGKTSVTDEEAEQLRLDVQRVIRLPRAYFEADSDEEGTPYCTVPAARNKRALTLSAQGRSIRDIISEHNNKVRPLSQQNAIERQPKNDSVRDAGMQAASTSEVAHEGDISQKGNTEAKEHIDNANAEENHQLDTGGGHEALTKLDLSQPNPDANKLHFKEELHLNTDPLTSAKDTDRREESSLKDNGADNNDNTFLTQAATSISQSSHNNNKPPIHPTATSPKPQNNRGSKTGRSDASSSRANNVQTPVSVVPSGSPSIQNEHVKLSLRKEKNRTREHTYMFQVFNGDQES